MGESDTIWLRNGRNVEDLPDPFTAPVLDPGAATLPDQPPPPRLRRRRWRYIFYALSALLLATLLWLIITAPLGRALEPLADPVCCCCRRKGYRSPGAGR